MIASGRLDVRFCSYSLQTQAHTHPYWQIVLPSRGVLELEIAGQHGRVDDDRAAVIGAGERHAFAAPEAANRFLVLDVPVTERPDSIQPLLTRLSERGYVGLTPAAHYLIGYAAQIAQNGHSLGTEDSRRTLLWLELLLEAMAEEDRVKTDSAARSLHRATVFIDRHYDQSITMADVARAAGLGASRLYELFQERLGITPRARLAQVRLRHAQALLARTALPIAEIAVRTGHADQSTLTRHLRRALGVTPAAYRRRAAAGQPLRSGGSARNRGENDKP